MMKHIIRLTGAAMLLVTLFTLLCFSSPSAYASTHARQHTAITTRAMAVDPVVAVQQVYQYVNAARSLARVCGSTYYPAVPPLNPNSALEYAAQWHSYDMAYMRFFSHTGSDGSQPWDRAKRYGYNWAYIGENIAAGNSTAQDTVQQWLNSPGHCSNIMNANYVDMGAGFVEGGPYQYYWTLVLGRPVSF